MVQVESLHFVEIPTGAPEPGKHTKKVTTELDVDSVSLDGGVVVKTKALSLDPYMRGRMRDASKKSYTPAFELNQPMTGHVVLEVVRSDNADFKKGDALYGFGQFSTYAVLPKGALGGFRKLDNQAGIDLHTYVGAAGMPGHTAWHGFELSNPKKGETIFVTSAAGAVGQIVVQLAKAAGLKVIASAGDADKVAFAKELGADVAFNYKEENTADFIKDGFDIFWDNVGGETLEAALTAINKNGRVIACGAISQYNLPPDQQYGVKNTFQIVAKELRVEGFIILNHTSGESADTFFREFPGRIAKGEIKVREHVTKGLDNGEAFADMLSGKAQGKSVVVFE